MFAAVFNRRRRRLGVDELPQGARDSLQLKPLGGAGQAMLVSGPRSSAVGRDAHEVVGLDDRLWLAGRIRLDGRGDLLGRLAGRIAAHSKPTDAELCLHAYAAGGERFVDALRGDFSFVLWDDAEQRLVCVRDQIGVRELYHAALGDTWFVSDSLDWLAALPGLRRDLDDFWVADFLVANLCLDFERTVYREISRLPPAHLLVLSDRGPVLRRYWQLEIGDPLQLHDGEVTERFRALLDGAISDRLPRGAVGVAMSGGLDSTTLAASAVDVAGDAARVVAECDYFERLMPDDEKHFSALAARHLGIELYQRNVDDLTYDPLWRERPVPFAEPCVEAISARRWRDTTARMSAKASVWFYGEGPDNALRFDRDPYLAWLRSRHDWRGLAGALLRYARVKGVDGWWASVRRHTSARRQAPASPRFPEWLAPDLVWRLNLEERFSAPDGNVGAAHPWHPRAVASFKSTLWQRVLGDLGSDEAFAPFEWRHPFLDLRLLHFMLSLPPIPWAWEKQLMRATMRGRLPAAILARKKAPLRSSPILQPIREHGLPAFAANSRLADYVDVQRIPAGQATESDHFRIVSVHVLDHWLATSGH